MVRLNQRLKLSKRLLRVASFLPAGTFFADIGSDHALLPCYVCLNDPKARAIAGEVVEGPYNSAVKTVKEFNLSDVIDVRLGDGLQILTEQDQITEVVIAGMGGLLIQQILDNGKDKIPHVNRIIVQPNIGALHVRKWFERHSFVIIEEKMIEENHHFYEIIVADKCDQHNQKTRLDEKELFFGPILLQEKTTAFLEKWESERKSFERIIKQMYQAKQPDIKKIAQYEKELQWIKEVLSDEVGNH